MNELGKQTDRRTYKHASYKEIGIYRLASTDRETDRQTTDNLVD